jgi:hypothetical protein
VTQALKRVAATEEPEPFALAGLAPAAWAVAFAAAVALFIYAGFRGDASPVRLATAVFAVVGALWFFPRASALTRRPLLTLFLLALGVRIGAAVFFDAHANAGGDPFAGSPDAWTYDFWARRLVTAWSEGRALELHAFTAAARWDVGFHYLLAVLYATFGTSVLAGRVLCAVFGASAVVFFFLSARRIAGERAAVVAGLLYAFWASSVVWATYSVLRDCVVWALLLLSVWLVLRVVDGARLAALGLLLTIVCLRTIRPYAAYFVVLGLVIVGFFALVERSRSALRPALVLAGVVLASEAVFVPVGFPNAFQMVLVYKPERVLLKSLSEATPEEVLAQREALMAGAGAGSAISPQAGRPAAVPAPAPLFGRSLPANTIRFFLSPPGWAPVSYGLGNTDNWHLPGMWLWYAVLPAAALGAFLSLRGRRALKGLVLTACLVSVSMIVMGRGDAARHREMIVPVVLLCFATGVLTPARTRRRLLLAYAVYAAVLAAGIAVHRRTLKARGLARLEVPVRNGPEERAG